MPGVTPTKWTTIWRRRFPAVRLEVVDVAEPDQRRVLDDAEVDMCFVRLPVDTEGLHLIRLYEEEPDDGPSATVGLAWPVGTDHPSIQEFIGVVRGRTENSSRTVQERGQRDRGRPTRKRRHRLR